MTVDQILEILETRKAAAAMTGNTTELSLIYEIVKLAEDYKKLKEQVK